MGPASASGRACASQQRGAVLLEYVILLVCIVAPLVVGEKLFNPAGDYKGEFGTVGTAFHSYYTNLVIGVGGPTP